MLYIAVIKSVDSAGDKRSKPHLPMKHRWLCQRGLGPPLSLLARYIGFYFLAFPEIDSIEILKTLVLSLSFAIYFNPSETKFLEYLCI
jgi:hypothetical protein